MVCLFCFNETNDGVSIFGESHSAKSARNLIVQHFWFDIYEINAKGNFLCSKCWVKLESFHEFYHTVKVTHRNRFKGKNADKSATDGANKANGAKLKEDLLRLQNKTKVQSTSQAKNSSVTIKKKRLKLNSNSRQSKEVNLEIEEDGKNIRCNILTTTGTLANKVSQTVTSDTVGTITNRQHTQAAGIDENDDDETGSESESEYIGITNYPTRQIKMEEELIIMDDDSYDDSMNEFSTNVQVNAEGVDQQQPRTKRKYECRKGSKCNICGKELGRNSVAEHQVRKHFMCRKCKQTFRSYPEVLDHMIQCKCQCHLCEKSFNKVHSLRSHLRRHMPRKPNDVQLKKTANEIVLKQWASLITQK